MSNPSKLISVRNPEGIWINTACFREEAKHFTKYGYYCPDPKGSPAYKKYWDEQLRRTIEGYSTGGVRITGDHYFYLNFSQIQLVQQLKGNIGKKITSFPDFWDGDYNYFWVTDIARYGTEYLNINHIDDLGLSVKIAPIGLEGGRHVIVGKSRRKGYSYKNGARCANKYNNEKKSLTIIGAFLKEFLYPKGTMQMASDYLEFLNAHTAWTKRREYANKPEEKESSFTKYNADNIPIKAGYQSMIKAITFKDNPDAARGKDATIVLFEEAGKFPNLEASYTATEPTLRSGKFITGQIVIFGTGGDMESGTVDFANMFYNPDSYNLMPFMNIWDENSEETNCGFFHPTYWNEDGFYDKDTGQSHVKEAIEYEAKERTRLLKNASGKDILQRRVQEYCMKPSEAFLTVSHNDFPVTELRNRLNFLEKTNHHLKVGIPVTLYRKEDGTVGTKVDLKNELNPIWNRLPKTEDRRGAVIIYEFPQKNAVKGLYKLGYDPYANENGSSLTAIYVYKGTHKSTATSTTRENLVASYIGRPGEPDDANRIFELLIELYNADGTAMYENMVYHVKSYFAKRKKLHLLALQPDQVISKAVKSSSVKRTYGCHMDDKLKAAGEKYIKQWLLREWGVDGEGNVITTIDLINDPGLLEELIMYNRKGNFDRVMALMMVMFQCEEEELETEYGDKDDYGDTIENDLQNLIGDLFQRN